MSTKTIITERVIKVLGPLGFSVDPLRSRNGLWAFHRLAGGVSQSVEFVETVLGLDAQYRTSYHGGISASMIDKRLRGPWEFYDDDSLCRVTDILLEITLGKGIPWLEKYSKAPLTMPIQWRRKVFEASEEYALEIARRMGWSVDSPMTLIDLANFLVAERRNCDLYQPDWIVLAQSAALFGEILRAQFGGSWYWDQHQDSPCITGLVTGSRVVDASVPILGIMLGFWVYEDSSTFLFGHYEAWVRFGRL